MSQTAIESSKATDLRESLIDEIFKAAGLSENGIPRQIFGGVFSKPADRFATFAAQFDELVAQEGIRAAAQFALNYFGQSVQVVGSARVPLHGPTLIAGNHPGSLDGFCILASLPRQDVRFVVSGVPLTHALPAMADYLIYAPGDKHERMLAIRSIIRQLEAGGTVLIFPSGRLDPDPDVLPGAEQALELWSSSLEIVLRKVPNTQVVIAVTSGVLAKEVLRKPITRLQKGWRRQKLAEFIQIGQMLFNSKKYSLNPRLTLSAPMSASDGFEKSGRSIAAIIAYAKHTLNEHMQSTEVPYQGR